jgi:CheY-like chemotaxis protein
VPPARAPRGPLDGVRVLLVEDHDDSRDVLQQLLEADGARVLGAASGAAALAALASSPTAPDVILLDLRMPDMTGLALAARVRETVRWREIPLIAVSGATTMADLHATLAAGFQAHVPKPIDPDIVVRTIQRVLEGARRRRAP